MSSSNISSMVETDPAVTAGVKSLVSSAEGFLMAKYLAVACFAWLIYDHLTTFDQEVHLFIEG